MYCNLRDQQVRQMINNLKAEGLALEHVDILCSTRTLRKKSAGLICSHMLNNLKQCRHTIIGALVTKKYSLMTQR
jgi:hypothetical protein